jgi:hypothetical protein
MRRPRWLCSVGRDEEARVILAKYHSANNDVKSPVIDLEMSEIQEKIEIDGQDSQCATSHSLFKTLTWIL